MASCIDSDDDVQIGGGKHDDSGQTVRRQHDDAHQVGGGQNNDARCNGTRTPEERFFRLLMDLSVYKVESGLLFYKHYVQKLEVQVFWPN